MKGILRHISCDIEWSKIVLKLECQLDFYIISALKIY